MDYYLTRHSTDESDTPMLDRVRRLKERADVLANKIDRKANQIDEARQELEAIRLQVNELIIPPEPGVRLVSFVKTYGRAEKRYRFAAVKSDDDRWYVTGTTRRNVEGMTWESLVKTICGGEKPGTIISVCLHDEHARHVKVIAP